MKTSKIIIAAFIWLIVLAAGVSLWKLVLEPMRKTTEQQKKAQEEADILAQSTGNSVYKNNISLALDAFSGYAVLRSPEFQQILAQRQIRLTLSDDQADYAARLESLASGKVQMAAFPIDALIKACAETQSLPATIVCLIDESHGADAIVGYKQKFPNIMSTNDPSTRFVFVGNSPSETLARLILRDFELPKLAPQPFTPVASSDEVIRRFRAASPTGSDVFVTWEPFVSEMLRTEKELHVLVDSSNQTGFIVDALVVSRDFLVKNQPVVEQVLEAYFSALHGFREPTSMKSLIIADAKATESKLSPDDADALVKKIAWKNTQENFAHFGLREGAVVHLENMIEQITTVLKETDAIEVDPTGGQPNRLFFDPPMAQLQTRNFHPGLSSEKLSEQKVLKELTENEWDGLVPVGKLKVRELVFSRGSARLTERSNAVLDELSAKLQSWPDYYLTIRGSANSIGNVEKNRELARQRADAAREYLLSLGIGAQRMRVVTDESRDETLVTFEAAEPRY